ncbi:hypothetical protein KM043_010566 [Ampulex compressa]|nr:hypothetical protein KM043_010566 [Ampulex compressa]
MAKEEKEANARRKLKYPRSIFFIVSNEFCERFSYYGMRTILTLYLRNKLNYSNDTSTVIYHIFTMFVYFFPLFGAMLADSILGKFRTIFYLSIIYALGQLLLSLSAAPIIQLPPREFSLIGLLLIALGTGGIKPCVSAFGGDQFVLPQQERYLSTFFSLFYFSINSGSLISSFLTPILRSDVSCFGENTCYSLAFFVPAVLMAVSIVIFIVGKPLYKIVEPTGNVVLNVSKCVCHAIYAKATSKGSKKEHWLDHAEEKYGRRLIEDIKASLQVLKLFLPLPVFWALFDQQGSRWTIQATRMDGQIGSFMMQPDQMQVMNPFLVVAFIPLFETCIYPLLAKVNLLNTPLKKLTVGGLLAALSFVLSALVELQLEKTYPILPSQGLAQVRVFNTMNCSVGLTIEDQKFALEGLGMWEDINVKANGSVSLDYEMDLSRCSFEKFESFEKRLTGRLTGTEAKATSFAVTPYGLSSPYEDAIEKSKTGNPLVRALIYATANAELRLVKDNKTVLSFGIPSTNATGTKLGELKSGNYDLYLDEKLMESKVALKLGGVYTVVGHRASVEESAIRTITVTAPNSMHILWLIPQYVVITMAEVMFSVTGLEFAFTQAPISMKSLLQAVWLLTVAFGNLIVVIIAEMSFFSRQANEFFLFAGLMFAVILIFAVMAKFYKYVEIQEDESMKEDIALEAKNGTVNTAYKDDEK